MGDHENATVTMVADQGGNRSATMASGNQVCRRCWLPMAPTKAVRRRSVNSSPDKDRVLLICVEDRIEAHRLEKRNREDPQHESEVANAVDDKGLDGRRWRWVFVPKPIRRYDATRLSHPKKIGRVVTVIASTQKVKNDR